MSAGSNVQSSFFRAMNLTYIYCLFIYSEKPRQKRKSRNPDRRESEREKNVLEKVREKREQKLDSYPSSQNSE